MKVIGIVLLGLLPFLGLSQKSATHTTYAELIDRVYDLEHLASPPLKGEQSGTFTSYDRRAKYDEKTNTYVHWEANELVSKGRAAGWILTVIHYPTTPL